MNKKKQKVAINPNKIFKLIVPESLKEDMLLHFKKALEKVKKEAAHLEETIRVIEEAQEEEQQFVESIEPDGFEEFLKTYFNLQPGAGIGTWCVRFDNEAHLPLKGFQRGPEYSRSLILLEYKLQVVVPNDAHNSIEEAILFKSWLNMYFKQERDLYYVLREGYHVDRIDPKQCLLDHTLFSHFDAHIYKPKT